MSHHDKNSLFHPQNDQQLHNQTTSRYSTFPSGFGVGDHEVLCPQSLAYVENFFRPLIREEVEDKVKAHNNLITCQSCSNSSTRLKDVAEDDTVIVGGGGFGKTNNLKLRFMNKIPSTIFTTNDIEAENGEELQVGLFDIAANYYIVDATHPLSSVLIEVVVLDGEFDDEEVITLSDFYKSVVSQRLGERPLLVGDGKRFRLKNGVSSITNVFFTRNSSRTRTKNIRLGLRVIHDSNDNCPTIQHAVSNPFRVKDHRVQLNKKHHPPRGEDEVWRLEGIGRNGEYHKRLSSEGILTVDSFVKAHQRDYRSLRKLLGNRLSDKKWKAMVNHALEYVPTIIPTSDPTSFEQNLVQNEAMEGVEVGNQNTDASNLGDGFQDQTLLANFQQLFYNHIFQDHNPTQTLLSHGEASTSNAHNHYVENTSTCNQYFQGAAWNKLVPNPK
ncbi:calmodulin-binding protein 60 D-like isoform X2 [Benincasa hispida]|uniref:calmodulin-binding protein 60 D-like isoform X2 n=1 Tax=Benincasa hispida TaxID=102211 RepID=UPI0018FFD2D1|nr:calmodulin-binding protein 60 D-like isoform X2 [Benincasa hispida]